MDIEEMFEREIRNLKRSADEKIDRIIGLKAENKELEAENKRLREALEVIDKSDGFCTIKEIILHVRHVLKAVS